MRFLLICTVLSISACSTTSKTRDSNAGSAQAGRNIASDKKASLLNFYTSKEGTPGIASGDFDKDGATDLIVVTPKPSAPLTHDGDVLLYPGTKDGKFSDPPIQVDDLRAAPGAGMGATTADFNGDGCLDFAVVANGRGFGHMTGMDGSVYVYLGNCNREFKLLTR
ncbi:MAG: FG-GAP repeat domain-containing protein [Pseudobdellovibrionaceae bacterium]